MTSAMRFAPPLEIRRAPACRAPRRFLAVLYALCISVAGVAGAAEAEVLILLSRSPSDPWAVAELDGMHRALHAAKPAVEYMDAPGNPSPAFESELLEYLRTKYAAHRFRVILAADLPAVQFILQHRDALWPQAQAVFCGVTATEAQKLTTPPWLAGIIENTDPAGAVRLALALQPRLQRLVVLEDSAFSARVNLRRIEEELPELKGRVEIQVVRADTARALFRGVENLPAGSAVLLTRAQVARRMGAELLARCPVPIYGQRSPTHLGAILGGAMIDGERHGEAAARLGLRLLAGETAGAIPWVNNVPSRVVVDYVQMQRFGLPFSALPPGAEILHRPRRVWQAYPVATLVALAALVSLAVVAAVLGLTLRANRRNARALKTSLSLLHATLDASADGVLVVDLKGSVSGFNRRFVELWNIPAELAERRDDHRLLEFVTDQLKDPEAFQNRVAEIYATPQAESFETIEFKDGRVFERRCRPQRLEGQVVGRVWTFADITARCEAEAAHRRLQARLAHTHRLESLGTLAGGIAHDFNNLLTAILGYTNLAHDSLAESDPIRADLAAVLQASERARDLVRQILAFSRKSPSERHAVRCEAVVREAVRLLRATVPAGIDIQLETDETDPTILADTSQIHQVILNLGTNAAHALRGRTGRITLRIEEVPITPALAAEHPGLGSGHCLCIAVRDNGEGMNDETLRRAFDPFFTTKGPGDGTGLGLAVVHGIVESHGGAVNLESAIGEGTTVRLFFPLVPAEAESPAQQPVPAALRIAGLRILVVDDEQSVLGVAEQLLHRAGHAVTACSSAMSALSRLRSDAQAFDVLLSDLNMPQMNGTELAAEARRLRPDFAIVFATGFPGDEAIEQCAARLGIEEIVAKPFDTESLLTAIQRAYDRAREGKPVAASA